MDDPIKILQAEQIDGGVLITFADDRTALFSAKLLYSQIEAAEEIFEKDEWLAELDEAT